MKITPLPTTGPDDRGFTAEYFHERNGKHLLLFRKAGTISGRHYHKGISPAKDPEILILVHGDLRINWRHVDSTDIQTQQVSGPAEIRIPPFIWHEVISVTDCFSVEQNSIEEHVADLFFPER